MGIRERAARRCEGQRGLSGGVLVAPMLVGGIILGAGLMYLLDARRSRTAEIRGLGRREGAPCAGGWVGGALPEDHAAEEQETAHEETADAALARQVRVEVERVASHPELITATAVNGIVTLRGAVPMDELKPLLRRVADVHGIELIENRLDIVDQAR